MNFGVLPAIATVLVDRFALINGFRRLSSVKLCLGDESMQAKHVATAGKVRPGRADRDFVKGRRRRRRMNDVCRRRMWNEETFGNRASGLPRVFVWSEEVLATVRTCDRLLLGHGRHQ